MKSTLRDDHVGRPGVLAAALLVTVLPSLPASSTGAGLDEFKVKRQEVFEFADKPAAVRNGDNVTITFAAKGYCDVTVAIEDGNSRIVRHLASGVLGPNAPAPFQKDSLKQSIVWDGKDDRGKHLDNLPDLTVRVSLGLKPQFERTLYWSPHKRISNLAPLMAATLEGVYVFQGLGVDHLQLFDHAGQYVRTVYPFPAGKIGQVAALQTQTFPQDGQALPLKVGYQQATLLTSGSSAAAENDHAGGFAATSMAVCKGRIALAFGKVNRLATDGTSGGLPLEGPVVSHTVRVDQHDEVVGPTSMAFSPDGKYLYMTGFVWKTSAHMDNANAYHCVKRMEFASQDPPAVFAGVDKADGGYGDGNDRLCVPLGVDCDSQGRVYVADYANSRIQVFSPDGKLLKTLRTPFPAVVKVERSSGQIWAFSWPAIGPCNQIYRDKNVDFARIKPTLVRLGTFDKPASDPPEPLPLVAASGAGGWVTTGGQVYQAELDWFAPEPTLWVVGRRPTLSLAEANWMSGGGINNMLGGWDERGIKLMRRKNGAWGVAADFSTLTREKVQRTMPSSFARQRLYVNPADQKLYVCEEQTGPGKSFYTYLQIDPNTGTIRELNLPFDPEDIAFDIDGLIYMRTDREVMRFDPVTWREVPWDYGEERVGVGFCGSSGPPRAKATAALAIPGTRPVWWHSGGLWISPKGHLAVECNIPDKAEKRQEKDRYITAGIGKKFIPTIYPGRSGTRIIQIFDSHGTPLCQDASPGMTNIDGVGIDNDDNLYVMLAAPRVLDGRPYFDEKSETLMKFRAGKVKFISSGNSPVALGDEQRPKRPADVTKYGMSLTWGEGADWYYGGVGYGGQGGSCVCWHARFQLDYFARSFVPETRRFNVAVLDANGNLILRIGKYGNVDDGRPLVADGGPAKTQAVGGDEVALSHAAYVGTHTDRRLFIHDAGNGRIVSVKLDYHATERVGLK